MERRNEQKMAELHTVEKAFVAHDFVCHDTEGVFERNGGYPVGLDAKECEGVELLRANKQFYNRILVSKLSNAFYAVIAPFVWSLSSPAHCIRTMFRPRNAFASRRAPRSSCSRTWTCSRSCAS